jgi:hypothetical protein
MKLKDFWDFWYGKSPPVRVNVARDDDLHEASATRGTLILGDPGSGKTRYAAMQIVKRWTNSPHPVFIFDWSGGITNCILDIISKDKDHEKLLEKVVLDELGNNEIVISKPENHSAYGLTDEEQTSRWVDNIDNLATFLSETASFVTGVSIREIGKHLFRLLQVIKNENGETWQVTEALDLITDHNMLKRACQMYGQYALPSKRYFERQFLPKDIMPPHEKQLLTTALRTILGTIDGRIPRATLGYYKPGWTPKEADENDLLVLIDAHNMINTPAAQHYLLAQNFSHVMYWINKREVDNPANKLTEINFDETVSILKIPGFAEKLGSVSPLYRSRRVSLMVIIQALWQLDDNLREQIWNLANVICFTVSNLKDAEAVAEQLLNYDPKFVKNYAKTDAQNNTTEPEGGQNRLAADWLQNLKAREFIMRRYISEQQREKGVQYIPKTDDFPMTPSFVSVPEIKKELRRTRGVPIRDSLEVSRIRSSWLDLDKSDPNF